MFSNLTKYITFFFRTDFILPAILILVYVVFMIIARKVVPSSEELVSAFATLYNKYGYEIIFFAALLETLVIVNIFAPGQLAMALGIVFARSGQTNLALVILVACSGSICGYLIDYILGQLGFAKIIKKLGYGNLLLSASKQLKRFGKRGLVFGFIQTNVGGFLSVVAGAADVSPKVFIPIAIIATFFWLSLWALLIYIFGEIILTIINKFAWVLIFGVVIGMILNLFWKEWTIKRKH